MDHVQEFRDDATQVPVRGFLHIPAAPRGEGLVLTHGAGANCNAPLLVALATVFCASGIAVLRCDLPFRQLRPKGPPLPGSVPRDQAGLKSAVALLRRYATGRIFLGGHSYGGRQASMLCATQPATAAETGVADRLLLLSYPLHPPQQPAQLRTAHLPQLHTPGLFVHGTRDAFGTLEEMRAAIKLIPAPTQLFPIADAGHELLTKRNWEHMPHAVLEAFESFAAAGG